MYYASYVFCVLYVTGTKVCHICICYMYTEMQMNVLYNILPIYAITVIEWFVNTFFVSADKI